MRQDFFTYLPQFKLLVAGNHKPRLRSIDEAIRRRFYLVPFTVTIPPAERDRALFDKLKQEWSAILGWVLQGCLEWQAQGLNPPAAVLEATSEYFDDEDSFGRWLEEACVRDPWAHEATRIARIADPYCITVQSTGGFDSSTAKHALAEFLSVWPAVEVLHIGDHDPSGVHVFANLAENVRAMLAGLGSKTDVVFTRLAVTPEQIAELGLPTAPPKATERRRFDGEETVQAEAIPPDVLADIVRQAILDRLDEVAAGARRGRAGEG